MSPVRTSLVLRLRDQRGFMLAEQLVSIIFIGMLCIIVAAGMGAAMSAYRSITEQTHANMLLADAVERVSDEFAYALSVEGEDDVEEGEVLFVSATQHLDAALLSPDREESSYGNAGIYMTFESDDTHPVHPIKIVPPRSNLIPVLEDVKYYRTAAGNMAAGTWSFRISIKSSDYSRTLAETTMTVKRIGS